MILIPTNEEAQAGKFIFVWNDESWLDVDE